MEPGHWLKPQLLDPQRLKRINQRLQSQAPTTGPQPASQALLGIKADGAHLQPDHFDQELFDLLTDPALVGAVKEVSGLKAVRPFQFDLLTKAPGGPGTPWHRDRDFLPIDRQSYTCWIPLDPIPEHCTLVYAEGTAQLPPEQSSINHPDGLQQLLERHGAPIQALPAMQPGDVDIHQGQVWHYGPPNATAHWRRALGVAFVEDGTRLCSHPSGFCGTTGATMRVTTLRALFGLDAEGETLQGPRHPRL